PPRFPHLTPTPSAILQVLLAKCPMSWLWSGQKVRDREDSGRRGRVCGRPEVWDMASGGARKGIWIAIAVAIIIIIIVLIAIASGGDGGGNGY
ncbi:hypothetical protein KBX26_27005, partial [Micromonospora sp. C97]|uniref:hypothetical protein n=1 Tax=Micromonospora sp. C97 TaxID=2824883 RepID=UPI001B38F72E